ncbi:uncharacterized protein LOC115877474 [Sitophilus oryzae]|uniref:Uncharacterized protein LOC115877474 n=1 Tax=Sitophilus oryzae TaxID=7048 RepID=A0A6J2XDS8_SITOR|nr:uncharacterized protein LOC115877474 [Sitophilus oryzae]
MVRSCLICKKRDDLDPEVCFRSFPVNPEKRLIWLSIFGIEDGPHISKKPDICSDHFSPCEVLTRADGRRHIDLDAIPATNTSIFEDSSSSSSENTEVLTMTEGFPSIIYCGQDSLMENLMENENELLPSTSNAGLPRESHTILEKMPSSSSLSAETESESETEKLERSFEKQASSSPSSVLNSTENLPKQPFIRRKRKYIGDMGSSDFSTPEKRRRNLAFIKKRCASQRKRIHNLQMTVRRLKNRITSLKQLLNYLKDECLITELSL